MLLDNLLKKLPLEDIVFYFENECTYYEKGEERFDFILNHTELFDVNEIIEHNDEYGTYYDIYLCDGRSEWEKGTDIFKTDDEDEEEYEYIDWYEYNGVSRSDFL